MESEKEETTKDNILTCLLMPQVKTTTFAAYRMALPYSAPVPSMEGHMVMLVDVLERAKAAVEAQGGNSIALIFLGPFFGPLFGPFFLVPFLKLLSVI